MCSKIAKLWKNGTAFKGLEIVSVVLTVMEIVVEIFV